MAGATRNTSNGSPPCYYDFDVDVFACIETNNTLKVFWNNPEDGYKEIINSGPNWDGSELSETFFDATPGFIDGEFWPSDNSGNIGAEVVLTVILVRVEAGSTVVQIDWAIDSMNIRACTPSASFEIILVAGEGCTPPIPD